MLSILEHCFQRSGTMSPKDNAENTILNSSGKANAQPSNCKHAIFANCYLLVRDANQAKPDVIVPLNEDVLLTILKLCLSSSCTDKCVMNQQPTSFCKDSGIAESLLTTSTSSLLNDKEQQTVAEKETEACCSSEVSNAVSGSCDVLDLSIVSSECARALERAKLHRSSMLAKPAEADNDADWTDDEQETRTESSTVLCSSTPRRRKEMDAGFDRFWRSMSCNVRGSSSEAGSADDGVLSQVSQTTTCTEDVVTEATLSQSEQELATTIGSLDELADEPQAVLCSDFSWLYRHKRIRDTLLSIGATQSVLYEIMMRNRYYDECDEREQRMIVDTCKVRRAVEEARSARLERGVNGGQLRPACRYVFSDSEDDETEQDALPAYKSVSKGKVGRPRKLVRKQLQPRKKRTRLDVAQTDSVVDLSVDYNAATVQPVTVSATTDKTTLQVDAYETPNTTDTHLRLQLTRRAKEVAKRAIFVMINLYKRPKTKRTPSRKLKEPFAVRSMLQQHLSEPDNLLTPISTKPDDFLDQSFVIRSRKRKLNAS